MDFMHDYRAFALVDSYSLIKDVLRNLNIYIQVAQNNKYLKMAEDITNIVEHECDYLRRQIVNVVGIERLKNFNGELRKYLSLDIIEVEHVIDDVIETSIEDGKEILSDNLSLLKRIRVEIIEHEENKQLDIFL